MSIALTLDCTEQLTRGGIQECVLLQGLVAHNFITLAFCETKHRVSAGVCEKSVKFQVLQNAGNMLTVLVTVHFLN